MYHKKELYETFLSPRRPLLDDWPIQRSAWLDQQANCIREQAIRYLETETPPLPYALFQLYWKNGDRSQYQSPYFARRGRLLAFSMMAMLEPEDTRWIPALEGILWDICAEPFWCIPAHFLEYGDNPLPFPEYTRQLDLFACETGFAIAECLALLESRLSPDVVCQAELQLERRIFEPFLDGTAFYRFEAMSNNWSSVCASAIGGAALHRVHDPVRLTSLIHRVLSCLDVYLESFGDDGVCVEGVGYWTYGFGFFTCFSDLLERRSDGKLNLFHLPKVKAIATCQQHYYLTGANTVSFADGSATAAFRVGLSAYLQHRFPAAAIPDLTYAEPILGDSCYRYCLALRDFLWDAKDAQFGLPEAGGVYLSDAQWFLSRGACFVLAAKAGHNGESHNHNDCGSFLLCKQGKPLLCDLGAGLYDAAYFGSERYSIFVNASRSHSVPLPAGIEQAFGLSYTTKTVSTRFSEECDVFSLDLSGCYPLADLTTLCREFCHNKTEQTITITDHFSFETPKNITEVFVSRDPITLTEAGARFSCDAVTALLSWDGAFRAHVEETVYPDHDGIIKTAYRLLLESACAAKSFVCRFLFQ